MNFFQWWKPIVAMVGVDFVLATVNVLLKKAINQGLDKLVIVTYRQLISAIFLTPIAYFLERKSRPSLTSHVLFQLFFSALVGGTLTLYFFLIGLKHTSATFTCAFINMVPVNTFILALLFGLEKVEVKSRSGRAKIVGALFCIGGALVLTLYEGMPLLKAYRRPEVAAADLQTVGHGTKRRRWMVGSMFLTAGSLTWSCWFLIQSKIGKAYPFQYSSTAIMSSFSSVQSTILCMITNKRNTSAWIVKGKLEIFTVVYSGMVGSGLCYVVMSWCVKQRGPVFTSAFSPFIQMFVAIFDTSVLHEQIHLGSVVGSFIVIVGMYILLWGKTNEQQRLPG